MIVFLIGHVESVLPESVCLNVQGVGYEVFCPVRTLAACEDARDRNTEFRLRIHHHMREDGQALYGFMDEAGRAMFRQLIAISGVGPKVGLSILSTFDPAQIADAVATQNGKMLAQANGIGAKTGERIVRELKDKLGALPVSVQGEVIHKPAGGAAADVFSALMNLGYRESEVQASVSAVFKESPELAFDPGLKQALQHLRK